MGYWATLIFPRVPVQITISYITGPIDTSVGAVRTNDDVLLTKLNDYQLGGVYISLAI